MSLFSPKLGTAAPAASVGQAAVDDPYTKWMVAAALFFILTQIVYFFLAGLPSLTTLQLDGIRSVIGHDFLNTWMGGRSVFSGGPAPWFDFRAYNDALFALMHGAHPKVYWSYPPHIVLFLWPFGLLPYVPAYVAWCALGIALYLYASSAALPRQWLLFLAVAPGIGVCIFFGQNGFYTAALLIGGWLALDRRPILAGVLFGILTIKPQLGLLLPVMLVLERRWLTIASALLTTALLVTVTAMLFGWHIWIEFMQKVVPQQAWLTENAGGLLLGMVSSILYGGRLVGLPLAVDWALQYAVAALALAGLVWTYWRRRDPALSFAFLVTATFLVTPYILTYDMVVFGFVVALLRDRAGNTMRDSTNRDYWLLLAVWTLPVTMMFAALIAVPLAPIVLIAFASWLIWHLRQNDALEIQPRAASAALTV